MFKGIERRFSRRACSIPSMEITRSYGRRPMRSASEEFVPKTGLFQPTYLYQAYRPEGQIHAQLDSRSNSRIAS